LDGEIIMTKKENEKAEPEEKDEELEDQENENQQDAEFILSATHAPRQGARERFLIQSLAQALIMTDDLKRIKSLSLTAFMIEKADRENLAIDYQKVKVLNLMSTALLNPSKRMIQQGLEVVSISWGFPETEENFKTFILPWFNCNLRYWSDFLTKHVETWKTWECYCGLEFARRKLPYSDSDSPAFPINCPKCKKSVMILGNFWGNTYKIRYIVKEPLWSFFFEICQILSPEGYDRLKHNFVGWASELIQEFFGELTKIVDPHLYDQILGLYEKRGKKGYAEKVKETAKETGEMSADEGSLGPY